MSELVERVARVLLNAHFERGVGVHRDWDALNTFEKNMLLVSARAALAEVSKALLAETDLGGDVPYWKIAEMTGFDAVVD